MRLIDELIQEKNEAVDRAEKAEFTARKAIREELKALQEKNRKLRDQNFELVGSVRGRLSIPTTFSFFSRSCLDVCFICEARESSMS